ncbi:hypothetical protein BGZ54_005455 [Gamsiella multidivaricata]|nr:hypothetical protein BGZ54_005455 [Gamsiella multidivaricata]
MDAIAINNTESPTAREGEDVDSDADNTRPATCPHCSKEFQSKGLLRSHIVSHSSDRPFVCWDCTDKSYKRNHDLLRHRREKHNVDGMTIPSRGSSRSHVAEPSGTCEGGSVRTPHQATVASQSRVPHQEILYSNHGMMYFGNRGALSSLPSSSSGSPLDPHGGIEYGQHHRHGNPLLVPHTPNVGLGLGLELGIFGAKDFMGGFSSMTGGASTSSTSLITTKRKRKLSNLNSSTTPQVSSASMMIPLPNPVVPFETSGTQFTTTTNVSLVLRPPQQLSTLPGAFEGLDANMGHFGSGGI